MTCYLQLPPCAADNRRLTFYLAAEEWAARRVVAPGKPLFFVWQVDPTVIIGRNQDLHAEVNVDYCRRNGIDVCRRRSGGGCVYADRFNFMMSYITADFDPADILAAFADYTRRVAAFLRTLGLDAVAGSRNDVTIDGAKVSGNAFYHIPGAAIAHGTMLFDSDMVHISHAITPSRAKLESKGVKSVASRVTTIKRHLPDLPIAKFEKALKEFMADSVVTLSESDVAEIEEIESRYADPAWIAGKTRTGSDSQTHTRTKRYENLGEFNLTISLSPDNRIRHLDLCGDFFALTDTDAMLTPLLRQPYTRDAVIGVLENVSVEDVVPGLTVAMLADLIID